MLSKFAFALTTFAIAGVTAQETAAQSTQYRRGPTRPIRPTGPSYRPQPGGQDSGKEDFELADLSGGSDQAFGGLGQGSYGGRGSYGQYQPVEPPADDGIDRTGWWSYYSQYSPARVTFFPAPISKPIFATCDFSDPFASNSESGIIQLAQFPGYPLQVKYALTGLDVSTDYSVRINANGTLGDSCAKVGDEFNPLQEVDQWERPNPYQDPSRGRLTLITSDDQGAITEEFSYLLQNLSGHHSLIGRSLSLYTGDDDNSLRACCTIGRDISPYEQPKPKPQVQPAFNPGYGHYTQSQQPMYGGYQQGPGSYNENAGYGKKGSQQYSAQW